ncbi:PLD nuclease N-terminal domain-containing protein [Streptomyces sp. NEAU-174]|uniref:PLD nuclease N-terminal domain-containing protein n=1 Tax=Streptomyces sp. NEAU-174 TaxID=3458254 RepID=UPI00404429FC
MTSALVYTIYLIVGALYVYALVDCIRTPAPRIRLLPKAGWLIVMVLLPILGAIAWRNLGKRSTSAEDRVPVS